MTTPTQTERNPLAQVLNLGQSLWYDHIRRGLIDSGELQALIDDDGLRGVTSNPAIFEKSITGSTDYAAAITLIEDLPERSAVSVYEELAIRDIRDAADILRPVYDETNRRDGYVSFEVSPTLANDTDATISEAERLWAAVNRENLMVKVPGTPAGIPAIRHLIGRGININVTLLFSRAAYTEVANAYMAGLEDFAAAGGDIAHVASVASFFISRIDSAVDHELTAIARGDRPHEDKELAESVTGKVAIANAKLTYELYRDIVDGKRWRRLAERGAQSQRLLWASTSTKDPRYRDVLYVEELIGPDTVNTVPPGTFDAFRDHGRPRGGLTEDAEGAHDTMATLARLGINFDEITDKLLTDAVRLFVESFEKLLAAVDQNRVAATEPRPGSYETSLPVEIESEVRATVNEWQSRGKVRRLWARDATLWTGAGEGEWLGWLSISAEQLAHPAQLLHIADDVRRSGFEHALLLGMGGSSLCPEMLALTFGKQEGFPSMHVLDSTDPAQVIAVEESIDLTSTIFIVSSKSGSTLEPNIFKQYFFERVSLALGADAAGHRFVAITDPGSKVEAIAKADGFRHVAHGLTSIGGRYSALSNFGMVPGAVMGIDVVELLDRAERMATACASCVPANDNPGLVLGAIIGVCANRGRDKLTLVTSPAIFDLGAWLEQLLAESTGKVGKGVIPVDREPLGDPGVYGDDRLFVYLRLDTDADPEQDAAVVALESAGQPVVTISLGDAYDVGGEIFRWEFATAVAGAVIGINPFNQPDVEASKIATRELTSEYEERGSLPAETPLASAGNLTLFADQRNADVLAAVVGGGSVADYIAAHLAQIGAGDYAALLAYVQMTPEHELALSGLRRLIRDRTGAATCVGFGPRFLHSTGQAYKGGPNSGVFLQITCDDPVDLRVPGQKFTFAVVKAAQARGDFEVLAQRERRALRVHLGPDIEAGHAALAAAVEQALSNYVGERRN